MTDYIQPRRFFLYDLIYWDQQLEPNISYIDKLFEVNKDLWLIFNTSVLYCRVEVNKNL